LLQGVQLHVTAENGNKQSYEISYNLQTSSAIHLSGIGVTVKLTDNKLTIDNTSAEAVEYILFSTTGQAIHREKINSYSSRTTSVNQSGIYLLQVFMKGSTLEKKLIIN
jgi:hypothetical protein